MKPIYLLILLSAFFASCATNELTIRITEPAPVGMPPSVKKAGIVNRTDSKTKQLSDKMAEITKLNLFKADSLTALKAIDGLYEALNNTNRFEEVSKLNKNYLNNEIPTSFSPPLKQSLVQDICQQHALDALFVLEFLHTDTQINYDAIMVKKMVAGIEVNVPETKAAADTRIRLGWRIYDADGQYLYDEYQASNKVQSFGQGINPIHAIQAVTNHLPVIETEGYQMGQSYANDLLPYSQRVKRIYYVKGTDNFQVGKRLARANKWNDAADYWEKETNNAKAKIAGRAYYNMAIINEINGNLETALDWAVKSYTLFNNKKALAYSKILRARIRRAEELQRQTE